MSSPLFISDCVRKDGVTFLVVEGHELTEADKGRTVNVTGVSDRTVNGSHKISRIVPPSTIEFLQAGEVDIPAGIRGGAVSIEGEPDAEPEPEKETEVPAELAKEPEKHPAPTHPAPAHKPPTPPPAPKTHK